LIKANEHFGLEDEEVVELTSDPEKSVVSFGSEEAWEAFSRDSWIMDKYLGSWKRRLVSLEGSGGLDNQ